MIRVTGIAPLATGQYDRDGFVKVYKEAFSGPPYFETYSDEEIVSDVWNTHLAHGKIVLAYDDGKIIGLGCAIPLHHAPSDVQNFLTSSWLEGRIPEEFLPHKTWYMSELAVDQNYRRQGVAYQLVRSRLISASHAGVTHYVMRTASERSNSRHLYEKVGAEALQSEHDISDTGQVTQNGSQATKRVYLYGRASEALGIVTKLLDYKEGENIA